MGKYIHLFQSTEEFNQAIDNNFTEPWVSYTKENDKVDYYKTEDARKLEKPFTIEATQDGTTIYFRQSSYAVDGGLDPLKVEVSTDDGKTWTEVTAAPAEDDVPGAILAELDEGEKVLIRGRNEAYGHYFSSDVFESENCNFYADKPCYVYGNIMSLIGGDNFAKLRKVKEYAFAYFFSDYDSEFEWSWVLSKEGEELLLPATTLANSCYKSMFSSCAGLITAPKLPATTLASNCYEAMFQNCIRLIIAPELPATILVNSCYRNMFQNCRDLIFAPELSAMTLADSCCNYMFQDCISLTSTPKLSATRLADSCYKFMFYNCKSLTVAPELPATTLMDSCYGGMFAGCTNLTSAPELPATTLANTCYGAMFSDCKGLTVAPELPAITLVSNCYKNMFKGCTNLSYIKAMFTTTPASSYTQMWVSGVKATGTFVKNSEATWDVTGNNGVPTGWTVETADA